MLTQGQITQFRGQGYLLVENVLSEAEVEILREAITQLGLSYRPDDVGLSRSAEYLTIIHSEKMTTAGHRRILHLSWGPEDLVLPGVQIYPWPQPYPLAPLDTLV